MQRNQIYGLGACALVEHFGRDIKRDAASAAVATEHAGFVIFGGGSLVFEEAFFVRGLVAEGVVRGAAVFWGQLIAFSPLDDHEDYNGCDEGDEEEQTDCSDDDGACTP